MTIKQRMNILMCSSITNVYYLPAWQTSEILKTLIKSYKLGQKSKKTL